MKTKTTYFSENDILQMEKLSRIAFMNSLSGFKSASLIGTIDKEKNTNLAIFSSVVHLGSNPALIGFISRPGGLSRHTFDNIMETNCFTVNHIHKDNYKQAHQTSARYPKNGSEFDATEMTKEFGEVIVAPYVKECKIKYGLIFEEKHYLKINGTILVIGRVVEVIIPENYLLPNGAIAIEKAETVTISGLDTYHSSKKLAQLTYAKPDKLPQEII